MLMHVSKELRRRKYKGIKWDNTMYTSTFGSTVEALFSWKYHKFFPCTESGLDIPLFLNSLICNTRIFSHNPGTGHSKTPGP